jgi:hypothetical protein
MITQTSGSATNDSDDKETSSMEEDNYKWFRNIAVCFLPARMLTSNTPVAVISSRKKAERGTQ